MRGRRKIQRVIDADHSEVCFKPCGVRRVELESVYLLEDEIEAIRLSDYEGLYQEQCAQSMGISRSTFSRILEKAHKKISDALLHGKAISIHEKSLKEKKDNA